MLKSFILDKSVATKHNESNAATSLYVGEALQEKKIVCFNKLNVIGAMELWTICHLSLPLRVVL